MSVVRRTGKKPDGPIFGVSRGAIIPLSRKLGLPSKPFSQPEKEIPEAAKDSLEPKIRLSV